MLLLLLVLLVLLVLLDSEEVKPETPFKVDVEELDVPGIEPDGVGEVADAKVEGGDAIDVEVVIEVEVELDVDAIAVDEDVVDATTLELVACDEVLVVVPAPPLLLLTKEELEMTDDEGLSEVLLKKKFSSFDTNCLKTAPKIPIFKE